ncbi:hypothetical protein F4801DRAFT_571548 [Xylaria longipes]|nr:hypothetical protein F4801DRAFT_571548 [Xylaria longipes]RYC60914.1 hypothetical protein CHU98_g5298 [Xylaria longipes]
MVMANPAAYKLSPYNDPVGLSLQPLVSKRKLLRDEMSKIGDINDNLNEDPTQAPLTKINNPTLWARQLPVPIGSQTIQGSAFSPNENVSLMSGFSFVNGPQSQVVRPCCAGCCSTICRPGLKCSRRLKKPIVPITCSQRLQFDMT